MSANIPSKAKLIAFFWPRTQLDCDSPPANICTPRLASREKHTGLPHNDVHTRY